MWLTCKLFRVGTDAFCGSKLFCDIRFQCGDKKNEFKNKMQFKVNYTRRIWKISDSNNISQESVLLSKSGM